jgi:hypothetical protein
MPTRFAIAIIATAISTSPVNAQQMRGAGSGATGFGITSGSRGAGVGQPGFPGRGIAGGPVRFHPGHQVARQTIFLSYPYFYSDYGYDSPQVTQPQVIVIPASAPAPPPAPETPIESLLIEWQGDRFVRATQSQKAPASEQFEPDYPEQSVRSSVPGPSFSGRSVSGRSVPGRSSSVRSVPEQKDAVQVRQELPPAVLVYRDGRKEEVSDYTITSGTIYSKADYWSSGSWTKKIQIADLDVPATLKLNQERGLKFVLPASPNEVIMRP